MTASQFVSWNSAAGIGTLMLDRAPLNIMNIVMLREMEGALTAAAEDESLRVMLVRAKGNMFSAGVDVADHTAEKVGEMIPLVDRVCTALAGFAAPTLAAVHGHALGGGCEIALSCDLIVAAENAKFGQPEIKLATFAPMASMLLPGVVGYRLAAELLFTGEPVTASAAVKMGMITRAIPAEEFDTAVETLAGRLQELSAPTLRMCKRALRVGAQAGMGSAAALERLYLDELMATEDAHEGLAAFMEKRRPDWKHR